MSVKRHIIEISSDYARFVRHEHQQPISGRHLEALAESMKQNGFLPSKPVQVYSKGGKFHIIDGHHRCGAAQLAKVPVLYVIEPESHADLIGQENFLVKKWTNKSFADLYAARGNENYKTLIAYSQKGIPMAQAASMLQGESAHSSNQNSAVLAGTFKVKTTKACDNLIELWDTQDPRGGRIAAMCPAITSRAFIEAISILSHVEGFDIKHLAKKILLNPRSIDKCATRLQAIDVLEEVYNHFSKIKLPLAHLAKVAMAKRNPTLPKKAKCPSQPQPTRRESE